MFPNGLSGGCCKRFVLSLLVTMSTSVVASAQTVNPTNTQCKLWDDSYLFLFNIFLLVGLFSPLVLDLVLPPFLGRGFWGLTAPNKRIFVTTLIVALVLPTIFVVPPFVTGFGTLIFSGIDQSYFSCGPRKFGATGLLFGLVGAGTAAITEWVGVLILLVIACALGGLVTLFVSKLLVGSIGLRSLVRGGSK